MSDTINKWLADVAAKEALRRKVTFKEVYALALARAWKNGIPDFNFEFSSATQWSHGIVVQYRNTQTGRYHKTTVKDVVIADEDRHHMKPIDRK